MKTNTPLSFSPITSKPEPNWLRSPAPRIFAALVMLLGLAASTLSVHATSTTLVIAEVYGGGGNSGAYWKNDYIVIYNRGTTSVDVNGWSVQYASSTGSTWSGTTLATSSKIIPPGAYFLVVEGPGSAGTPLTGGGVTGTLNLSGTAGKVALCNSATALTGTCPTGGSIIDFVGFGGANCYEGSGPTPTLSNTTSAQRANNGCTDTDNNLADFA